MVAQGPLEAFVMVRIHVGQPILPLYKNPSRFSFRFERQKTALVKCGLQKAEMDWLKSFSL
jgi:hypothetical protein